MVAVTVHGAGVAAGEASGACWMSGGTGIDAAVNKSQTLQVAFKDQLAGERDVIEDVKQVLGAAGQSSGELQNLGVTALLTKIATQGSDAEKDALRTLLQGLRK